MWEAPEWEKNSKENEIYNRRGKKTRNTPTNTWMHGIINLGKEFNIGWYTKSHQSNAGLFQRGILKPSQRNNDSKWNKSYTIFDNILIVMILLLTTNEEF